MHVHAGRISWDMIAMQEHQTGRILFVDDEESARAMMQILLTREGHTVDTAPDGYEGLHLFQQNEYDLVIQDLRMPGMHGLDLLRQLKEHDESCLVVVLTAFSTWDTAVEAMRLGAYDYLKKPFDNDHVRAMVQRALAQKRMRELRGVDAERNFPKLVGSSAGIQEVYRLVRRVAPTDSTVVITGQSGTGKELVSRLLHLHSLRAGGPFIGANCGAFSETLLESELFGHVRGAFTGAVSDKVGLLSLADSGTFFLDELGEMSLTTQVRLLRMLETREFLPVGGTKPIHVDVRFVAATNRNLEKMVHDGTFREDLFYRLNVIPIHLPALRERRDDIPLLAGHFLALFAERQGKELTGFSPDAMDAIVHCDWPGNIRELENFVQHAVTMAQGSIVELEDLRLNSSRGGAFSASASEQGSANGMGGALQGGHAPDGDAASSISSAPTEWLDAIDMSVAENMRRAADGQGGEAAFSAQGAFQLDDHIAAIEKQYIEQALEQAGGNMTRAAELLGISFRSIRYKVKKLGILIR